MDRFIVTCAAFLGTLFVFGVTCAALYLTAVLAMLALSTGNLIGLFLVCMGFVAACMAAYVTFTAD